MKFTSGVNCGRTVTFFCSLLLCLVSLTSSAQTDDCTGAPALTIYNNTCGGATLGSTLARTQSFAACAGTADDDVWYSFVADGGPITVSVTSVTMTNPVFEVFSGSCGSLNQVMCRNNSGGGNESGTLNNLTNGNTYYIRVHSFGNGTGQGTFNICLTRPTPPTNDNCAGSTLLTPGATCVNTGGTLVNATSSGVPAGACGGNPDDDVWYRFVATSTHQMITLSSIGSSIAVNGSGLGGSVVMEVYASSDNTCGGVLSNVVCGTASGTNMIAQSTSFVPGNTYYIRVYSTNAVSLTANAAFNICVQGPPANDNCASAISLTPGATCVNTAGTLVNAANSGIAAGCGGTADDDVWFSFVATSNAQLVTVRNLGTNIAVTGAGLGGSAVLEVFESSTGTCAGILTNKACGTVVGTDLLAACNTYVIGNTYFVRVYSTNSVSLTTNANFNICVTNPPANDACSGAISLTPQTNCVTGAGGSQASGTLVNTSNSGIATSCGGTADDDVWYSFVAQYNTQNITLSGIGSNIAVSGAGLGGSVKMEVFASSNNTCGGTLTSIACGYVLGTSTNMLASPSSLTVGNTYFIRVYSNNNVALAANAGFNICVQNPYTGAPTLYFGKSFINITKGTGGGTVEPGDVLEIRAAVTLRPTSILDSCAFFDNVPAGTTYVPGSLAILTNEGKVYKSFTDAPGDDAGWISSGAITINMGYNSNDNPASATRKGRLRSGHIPTVSGSCVMLVSYRVTVSAALNSVINLGGGTFTYSLITDPTNVLTNNYNQNNVIVYTNNGLCTNASGVNVLDNGLPGDFNGTFGSGNLINRVASPNMPPGYAYTTLTGGRPGDFTYAIPNNTSNNPAGYSTNNNWPKPEASAFRRIFGVWDVIGDHTGATDQLAGNSAADTTNGGVGGYMLLVNAAYNLDTVFKYPISGLCPNTYYELSFWVRNVCSRCGVDSLGRGAASVSVPAGYIPTDVGDSSGVYPNLSFSIDDVNHYTTGNIKYTGQWVKKGFVFRTGVAQTSIVFAIANNAPGGGGNDWALDDISLATCTPNLNLVPSGNSQVCYGNPVDLNCNVISFFNNYVYYQWQVSRDNGVTWTDTLSMGTGTPTPSGGNYVYNASFPTFLADSSAHLVQYRIRVATTPANLYGGCSFYNSANIIVMVNNCWEVLKTNLVSFDAALKNKQAVLTWKTANETAQTKYEIQKSLNGTQFVTIGTVNSLGLISNTYQFTDPEELHSFAYYRIVVVEGPGRKNSQIKLLNVTDVPYDILSVVNPFREKLSFEISIPKNSLATIVLTDQHGKTVRVIRQQTVKGINQVEIENLGNLASGTYILKVITDSGSRSKKLIKISN